MRLGCLLNSDAVLDFAMSADATLSLTPSTRSTSPSHGTAAEVASLLSRAAPEGLKVETLGISLWPVCAVDDQQIRRIAVGLNRILFGSIHWSLWLDSRMRTRALVELISHASLDALLICGPPLGQLGFSPDVAAATMLGWPIIDNGFGFHEEAGDIMPKAHWLPALRAFASTLTAPSILRYDAAAVPFVSGGATSLRMLTYAKRVPIERYELALTGASVGPVRVHGVSPLGPGNYRDILGESSVPHPVAVVLDGTSAAEFALSLDLLEHVRNSVEHEISILVLAGASDENLLYEIDARGVASAQVLRCDTPEPRPEQYDSIVSSIAALPGSLTLAPSTELIDRLFLGAADRIGASFAARCWATGSTQDGTMRLTTLHRDGTVAVEHSPEWDCKVLASIQPRYWFPLHPQPAPLWSVADEILTVEGVKGSKARRRGHATQGSSAKQMIWQYSDVAPSSLDAPFDAERISTKTIRNDFVSFRRTCMYCTTEMTDLGPWPPGSAGSSHEREGRGLCMCYRCGWWCVYGERHSTGDWEDHHEYRLARGILRRTDGLGEANPVGDLQTELEQFLARRRSLSWQDMEDVTASVFRSHGFRIQATGRAGGRSDDHGLDLLACFNRGDERWVGVQVKHYKNKIQAELIRAFTGALVYYGLTRGIFVTSSAYTRGAIQTAEHMKAERGFSIKLIDADGFFERLEIPKTRPTAWEDFVPKAFEMWMGVAALPLVGREGSSEMYGDETVSYRQLVLPRAIERDSEGG